MKIKICMCRFIFQIFQYMNDFRTSKNLFTMKTIFQPIAHGATHNCHSSKKHFCLHSNRIFYSSHLLTTYFYLAMYIYMKKCCFSDRNSHRNYERVLLPSAWKFKFSNWNSRWHRIFSRITMRISLGKAAGFELYVTIYRAIFSQLL